ncbi:RNA recognition motif, partial [Trifolium medium]|nr:RNA recognition motif [Trifolium medium]
MRDKGRVDRDRGGSRRGRSRARSFNRRPHGYIHNVDQSSVSFFVTNFPEDCTSEDLWKEFARFGRVGDVFIPSKVDKWGKRFAFVKFREVKEERILSESMKEVWLGSFKLRINKSRFERKEGGRKDEERGRKDEDTGRAVVREDDGVNFLSGRSFRTALVQNSATQLLKEKDNIDEEVLQVEVDGLLLKELELSFVGKLALDVEVRRIKTTLYMEGLAHISVTAMGRNLVLIYSPKVGEVEALCKAKADWLVYYFKEVRPWSPSSYVNRRDTWVKVFGIPLHVWGENLFKKIGGHYGEFLDFDQPTASRSKLDVARIKLSTDFRGSIDDLLNIKALGVIYSLRIVEEKDVDRDYFQGERFEDHDRSWVASSNFPGEALEV